MLVKVFCPFNTNIIGCPTIIGQVNHPVVREGGVAIPRGKVDLTREDDVRRHRPTLRIDCLDDSNPFPISLLCLSRFSASFGTGYDYRYHNYTYQKTGLVEIVNVFGLDIMFRDCVGNKLKPETIRDWIFVKCPLVINSTV